MQELIGAEITPIDAKPDNPDRMLEELKHSIRIHLLVMQGPSAQLAVYLVKLIDIIEDSDHNRRSAEIGKLAFGIIEAVALQVHQSIDKYGQQAAIRSLPFPEHVQSKGDNLLVVVGKSRSLPDKAVAKSALLKEIAAALRDLSSYTKIQYPTITDLAGNPL